LPISLGACTAETQGGSSAGALTQDESVETAMLVPTFASGAPDTTGVDQWILDVVASSDPNALAPEYLVMVGYTVDTNGNATDTLEVVMYDKQSDGTKQVAFRDPSGQAISMTVDQTKAIAADMQHALDTINATVADTTTTSVAAGGLRIQDLKSNLCGRDAREMGTTLLSYGIPIVGGISAGVFCTAGELVLVVGQLACGTAITASVLGPVAAQKWEAMCGYR
jgi:hypothetical protein